MDYSKYVNIKPSEISYTIDIGLRYGEMPNEALAAKFEETADYNDGEGAYDTFARDQIRDWRPDRPRLECEEPRKSFDSKGYLNLLHTGSRSGEEDPRHSEMFLSETEKDPRGIATDPDFKKLTSQEMARMKYVRWGADADNSITGGGWDPAALNYAVRHDVVNAIAPRLKIFETEKDGRREGLRREFKK